MTIRFRMLLVIGMLALLSQSSCAQDYFKGLYLVHEKEFNSKSFSLVTNGLDGLSPKAYLYDGDGGGCKIALEKPGSWKGMVDIGGQPSPNIPQITLHAGDVVRIEYSGGNDPNSTGPVWALLEVVYNPYDGGKINAAPAATIVCDGKKRFYDILVPKDLDGKRLAVLYVTIRSPGPGGGEFTVYRAGLYCKPVNNRIDADAILKTPPAQDVKVGNHNGAMSILIDGKPITGLGWAIIINQNLDDTLLKVMVGDSNFKCARLMMTLGYHMLGYYPATWLGPDNFDWSYLDAQVGRLIKANPQTKIILQVALDGALWWVRLHPEAAGIDPKGMIPDYLSEEWKRDSRDAIRQMIAHIRTSSYADAIIGYQLMNGVTLDCNYEINISTPGALKRFSKFLTDRYKRTAALRKAWNDPKVTFDTAKPLQLLDPQASPNAADPYALLFAPGKNRHIADSRDFFFWTYHQVVIDFCQSVKEATHNRVIAGARIGNMLSGGWESLGGGRVRNLLLSPYFDYFDQWEPYPGRGIGLWGSGSPVEPPQGLADFGKMVLLQDDVRPHTGPDRGYGATQNAAETIVLQRRVFMNSMVMGQSPYLWQMSYEYEVPELMPLWKEQADIFDRMIHSDRQTGAEIAYVFDSEANKYLGWDPLKNFPTRGFALMDYPRFLFARAGVPYDMVLLEKLDQRKNYKVYVFFLTIGLDAAQRKMIDRVVKRDGKLAIFLWADGFIDNAGLFNSQAMSELVGMNISASTNPRSWKMRPSKWFVDQTGIKPDTQMGTLLQNEPCDPLADLNTYAPSFVVADPSARAIAHYEGTQDVAIAEKRNKTWSSIYCASMNLVPSVVKYALKQTGGFQYTDTDDICYINNTFIGFHTKQAGNIKLSLPQSSALYDVYNDKEHPASTSFDIPVVQCNTYLFYRGTKQQWESLKTKE